MRTYVLEAPRLIEQTAFPMSGVDSASGAAAASRLGFEEGE